MVCLECEGQVSRKELDYSVKHYGKVLCRDCQEDYSSEEKSYQKQKEKSTPEAIKLCEALKKMGFNAQLEKDDGYKHIDIAIPEFMVNIEVDGMQHNYNEEQALADLKRTYYSFKKGYVTLRIPNKLIQEKAYETAGYIKKFIEASKEQLEEE
ncbi:DUF559 domain-containing protein [Candidatus Woesearchaeota archaeon]|nr:DUF559 domain-containing protein [Candidatus Woesearchaeota archaeon]